MRDQHARELWVALLAATALGLGQPAPAAEVSDVEGETGRGSAGEVAQADPAEAEGEAAADEAEAAADEAAAAPAEPSPKGIEEILVTAERREESAQDIGASISAFSADDLERQLIEDVHDLALSVPSLQITGGLPALTLRGIGTDPALTGPALDPGFALHVNGTYAAVTSNALVDFLDMERVEVLHGPQGTLFGRNTTGGTLNFITARPTEDLTFKGDVEYGSFNKTRVRGTLNLPLIEGRLLSRVAIARDWTAKPFKFRGGGRRQELATNALDGGLSARGSLRWLPTESLTFDLIGAWAGDDSNGGGVTFLGDFPPYPPGRNPILGGGPNYNAATPNPSDPFRINYNRRQSQRWETVLGQGIVTWEGGPFTVTSTSTFQYFDYRIERDQDSSDVDAEFLKLVSTTEQWTQEILIHFTPESGGTLLDGGGLPLQALFGANYDLERNRETSLPITDLQANADAANFIILDALTFAPVTIFEPRTGPIFDVEGDNRTQAVGVFANLWLDVTEKLRFSGGIRYSWTHRNFDDESVFDIYQEPLEVFDSGTCPSIGIPVTDPALCATLVLPAIVPGANLTNTIFRIPLRGNLDITTLNQASLDKEDSWNSITGNLGVEYNWRPDNLLYASVSTGERAGGFNFFGGIFGETSSFDNEEILAFEVGSKNQFFDNRLQANLAVFHYDYDDRFIQETLNNITINVNAPSVKVVGADLSFVALVFDRLRLNGSIGWLVAEFDDDFITQDNSVGPDCLNGSCSRPPINLDGGTLPRSPEWTVSLGAEYSIEIGELGTLTSRIDHYYRDEVNFRQFENRLDAQESYHRTDAKLRFDPADASFWIETYVQNIQNEDEIKTQLESAGTHRQWWLAPPRVWGVRIGYEYF